MFSHIFLHLLFISYFKLSLFCQINRNKASRLNIYYILYLSSGVSTWKVLSMTVVHRRQRMMKVLGLGRSVFISWHSGGHTERTGVSVTLSGICCCCLCVWEMWRRPLTCYREVVERVGQVRVLRFVLVADERAVCLQQKVARSPVLDVLTCREEIKGDTARLHTGSGRFASGSL